MCLDCWGLVIRIRSTSNVVNFFAVRRSRIDLATLSGNVRAGLFMTRRRPLLGPVFFLLLLLAACAAPVTVERVDPRVVHRELTANVLTVGEESHASRIVLNRWYLTERFESDPEGTFGPTAHGCDPPEVRAETSFSPSPNCRFCTRSRPANKNITWQRPSMLMLCCFPNGAAEPLRPLSTVG